jgi:hypothetical protein
MFRRKENSLITLQSFMHFLKLMGLATNKEELMRACENLTDMLKFPLQDTLNIRNGITYS